MASFTFLWSKLRKSSRTCSLQVFVAHSPDFHQKTAFVSVWKGFYVIVPTSYTAKGILPPVMYIDHLMKHIQRPYYVGLLNAAAFYGAALQQPQVFSVIIQQPTLRDNNKKKCSVTICGTSEFSGRRITRNTKKLKPATSKYPPPTLTAADIIQYEKEIGGLNRACTVLNDLTELLDFIKNSG